jgi:hypothetical protein
MSESQQPQKTTDAEVGIHGRPVRIRYFLGGFITGVGCVVITAFRFAGFDALLITSVFLAMLFLLIGTMRPWRVRVEDFLEGIRISSEDDDDAPYRRAEPYAKWLKVRLQMGVGLVALVVLLLRLINTDPSSSEDIFALISYALAIAAAIELAHTLFTPGPDEALDPLALVSRLHYYCNLQSLRSSTTSRQLPPCYTSSPLEPCSLFDGDGQRSNTGGGPLLNTEPLKRVLRRERAEGTTLGDELAERGR